MKKFDYKIRRQSFYLLWRLFLCLLKNRPKNRIFEFFSNKNFVSSLVTLCDLLSSQALSHPEKAKVTTVTADSIVVTILIFADFSCF